MFHHSLNDSALSDDASCGPHSSYHHDPSSSQLNSELYTKSGKLRKVKEPKKSIKAEKVGKGGKMGGGEYEMGYGGNGVFEEEVERSQGEMSGELFVCCMLLCNGCNDCSGASHPICNIFHPR